MKTKQELINFIAARIYTNNAKAITAVKHKEVLSEVVESIYGPDLFLADEQMTGEFFNGKPVYTRLVKNDSGGGYIIQDEDMIDLAFLSVGINSVWIDYANSYYIIRTGATTSTKKQILPISMYDNNLNVTNNNDSYIGATIEYNSSYNPSLFVLITNKNETAEIEELWIRIKYIKIQA